MWSSPLARRLSSPALRTVLTGRNHTIHTPIVSSMSNNTFRWFTSKKEEKDSNKKDTALQHSQWVQFQQSIHIKGFDTGQTMKPTAGIKTRGGRKQQAKLQQLRQAQEADARRFTDVGGGKFPPLRYSDAETQRLLDLAYAAMPARAGKRGTRQAKRQANRWRLVRKIRAKYKHYMSLYQERKMIKRSEKVKAVKQVLQAAPSQVHQDRQYQLNNLQQWATRMNE